MLADSTGVLPQQSVRWVHWLPTLSSGIPLIAGAKGVKWLQKGVQTEKYRDPRLIFSTWENLPGTSKALESSCFCPHGSWPRALGHRRWGKHQPPEQIYMPPGRSHRTGQHKHRSGLPKLRRAAALAGSSSPRKPLEKAWAAEAWATGASHIKLAVSWGI